MNGKLLLPVIIFVVLFVAMIITLIIISVRRKGNLKKRVEELDHEKNQVIGVPILSELSKVKELVQGSCGSKRS